MSKKVSVCIPSYNAEKFISETIKSVLDSVYQNFEIIINDDASTDNTLEVVRSFKDSRIKFYQNEQNVGTVKNWNLAVTRATGEYVSLLNHDDLYGPFWLSFAIHQLDKNPHVGWAATAFRIVDENGKSLRVISRFSKTGEISRVESFLEVAKMNGLGPGFIVRRTHLNKIGYYDEDIGPSADNDLFLRLAAQYPLIYSGNYPHTSWRLHSDNLTHRWKPVDQAIESLKMLHKFFNNDSTPEDLLIFKNTCLKFAFCKAKYFAESFLQLKDFETYNKIISILKTTDHMG